MGGLDDVPAGMTGLLVQRVEPFSPAHDAGILRGQILLEVNRQAVNSVAGYRRAVQASRPGDVLAVFVREDHAGIVGAVVTLMGLLALPQMLRGAQYKTNFLLHYQGQNDLMLQRRFGGLVTRLAEAAIRRVTSTSVIDPSGTMVASETNSNQFNSEAMVVDPVAGRWTVRVRPENVTNASFRMRAKLESALPEDLPTSSERKPLLPNLRVIARCGVGFDAIDLPAGKAVPLAPGGYHVMLMGLKRQLKEGETVPLTLVVEHKGGKRENVEVQVAVRPLTYAPPRH